MYETYFCEECGEEYKAPPARIKTYEGYNETVELWFCDECSRYER